MTPRRLLVLAILFATSETAAARARAGEPPARNYGPISLNHCPIEFDRSTQLGASTTGILQECSVQPGDVVKARQVLGRLQDQDVRTALEARTIEAQNDVEIRLRRSKLAVAQQKLKTSIDLNLRRHLSSEELLLHKLETDTAALEVENAERSHVLAQIQQRQAEALVHSREFVAPFDGVVVSVLKSEGEAISPNDPVFRIVNTERVRVTGQLDVVDAWRVQAGQDVRIVLEVPGADLDVEREVFPGKVIFVDSQIAADAQTCIVVARAENRGNLLKGGLSARMEILPAAPAPAASAPAPAPARRDAPKGPTSPRPVAGKVTAVPEETR